MDSQNPKITPKPILDIITAVYHSKDRVFIEVSDGSLMQISLDQENIAKVMNEKPLLLGAEITLFLNDAQEGNFELGYRTQSGRDRVLLFSYDPIEQEKYIQSLEESN